MCAVCVRAAVGVLCVIGHNCNTFPSVRFGRGGKYDRAGADGDWAAAVAEASQRR